MADRSKMKAHSSKMIWYCQLCLEMGVIYMWFSSLFQLKAPCLLVCYTRLDIVVRTRRLLRTVELIFM